MKVILEVVEGPHKGEKYEFDRHDRFFVGRAQDMHFRLPFKDKALSRWHFLVEVCPPRCRVLDLASRNGTFVNGHQVEIAEVHEGDLIRAGITVLRVSMQTDDDDETIAPDSAAISLASAAPLPKYEIDRELGRGSLGIVYRARRLRDGATVALKVIPQATFNVPGKQVVGLFPSPNGNSVGCLTPEGELAVFDVATGKQLSHLRSEAAAIRAVTFSKGGDRIFTGHQDGTVRVWHEAFATPLLVLRTGSHPVIRLDLDEEDDRLTAVNDVGDSTSWFVKPPKKPEFSRSPLFGP